MQRSRNLAACDKAIEIWINKACKQAKRYAPAGQDKCRGEKGLTKDHGSPPPLLSSSPSQAMGEKEKRIEKEEESQACRV